VLKLRDLILSQFEPDIAVALLEWGKSLRHIDADVFVFLARKSLCLYDVLVRIGVPPVEKCVVSDRVLEMDLSALRRKKIALIDDTLIVGTSIAKARAKLEKEAEAKISTHAFCVDQDWHNPELGATDSVAMRLKDNRVMTFCAAEVRALSLVPRPYQVDFPLCAEVHLPIDDSGFLLCLPDWIGTNISTRLQQKHRVSVYTFFPTETIKSQLKEHLGEASFSCTDLLKIRVFVRQDKDVHHLQIIPIVTLKPLRVKTLAALVDHLLARIESGSGKDISQLKRYVRSPIVQQRLVQYILSLSLGEQYFRSLGTLAKKHSSWVFDDFEVARHYGPWLNRELSVINRLSYKALEKSKCPLKASRFPVTRVPTKVDSWIREILPPSGIKYAKSTIRHSIITSNLLAAFSGVFLRMYDYREIPARNEAKNLGKRWLDPTRSISIRDRLESGITWEMLVHWLSRQLGINADSRIRNLFSIMLDYCNDLGIAVPITCCQGDIVFRAYRHGEDVRFSDNELALVHHMVQGFLEANGSSNVPRLTLEKMLVILFRVGVERGFLEPLYGNTGTDGIARVKFDLMGARPMLQRGPRANIDRDIWLTDYLLERNVLKEARELKGTRVKRGKYFPNQLPLGNFTRSHSPDEAFELGSLVGLLTPNSSATYQEAPLDNESLILLATCSAPRTTANALQVELHILDRWLKDEGFNLLRNLNFNDVGSLLPCYRKWVSGKGHFALHSSKLKYVGYVREKCPAIIDRCFNYLLKTQPTSLLARKWQSYWATAHPSQVVSEKQVFDNFIHSAASLFWKAATLFSVVEIALCYRMVDAGSKESDKLLRKAFSKLRDYRREMLSVGVSEPQSILQICERFEQVSTLKQTEFVWLEDELSLSARSKTRHEPFDPKTATDFAGRELDKLMHDISAFVDRIEPMLEDFGKAPNRHEYKYMLYYDIVDSTATLAANAGYDVADYRKKISILKDHINRQCQANLIIAKKRDVEMFLWNGDKDSSNDSKYMFFSGKLCRRFVENSIKFLVEAAGDIGLRVRIEVVPCNFLGTSVYRFHHRSEVEGEVFWEHYSRLHKGVSDLEKGRALSGSTLFVATDKLHNELVLEAVLEWQSERHEIVSEIAMLSRTTVGHFGQIRNTSKTRPSRFGTRTFIPAASGTRPVIKSSS
jgi:hypothetical protein